MLEKLEINWAKVIRFFYLMLLGVAFFFAASAFNYYTNTPDLVKWLSPDETANYYFTKLYAQTGELTSTEKYNIIAGEIIHPRSFRSDNGVLKPVSFLGIILLYGKLGAVFGVKAIPYFTPFFAALGLIFFYLLIKELFGPSIGLISASLLAIFPPYLYFASRSMFHNILFIACLIISLYYALIAGKKERVIAVYDDDEQQLEKKAWHAKLQNFFPLFVYPAVSGIFMGMAIAARTSELLWLGPVLGIAWLANIRKAGITRLVVFAAALMLAISPVLYWNNLLYGSPLSMGYPQINSSIVSLGESSSGLVKSTWAADESLQKELFKKLKETIFYFGFEPKQSLRMLYNYFFLMFTWLFVLGGAGIIAFFADIKNLKNKQFIFFFCWSIASVILLFYYGSWEFHDNPDPRMITIGNSYTRYWLPIYLGAIPFASLLIARVTRLAKSHVMTWAARVFLVGTVAAISIPFVMVGSNEGLVQTALIKRENQAEAKKLFKVLPKDAVVVTQYHDKILWPERRVIVGMFDDSNMNKIYAKLAKKLPLYYYNFSFPVMAVEYLDNTKLPRDGLGIKKVQKITNQFTLYKLYATSTPIVATTTNAIKPIKK